MSDRLAGILLGTAVGDALGLPMEGLSPQRSGRLMPGPLRHRLCFGRGLVSDDTEHTLFVAQSLLEHPNDFAAFQRRLAWHLRWWLISLPVGTGFATARACVKLWCGFSPANSGVFSAGNGPAMRSAIIGGYFRDDPKMLERFVLASTRVTHTDPKATVGAMAIARVAAWAVEHEAEELPCKESIMGLLVDCAPEDREWREGIEQIERTDLGVVTVPEFASLLSLDRGVTGYMYHTVPVAVYAWLKHYGDFRASLESAIGCGGDADTVGAITGALAGATVGVSGIPADWIDGIVDWPRSIGMLRRVADRLEQQHQSLQPLGEVGYFWPAIPLRNLVFLVIVLLHGFRRLAPP